MGGPADQLQVEGDGDDPLSSNVDSADEDFNTFASRWDAGMTI